MSRSWNWCHAAVRTALMGQEEMENALPLDAFLDEVMDILGSAGQPDEILVKAVEPLRFAEAAWPVRRHAAPDVRPLTRRAAAG